MTQHYSNELFYLFGDLKKISLAKTISFQSRSEPFLKQNTFPIALQLSAKTQCLNIEKFVNILTDPSDPDRLLRLS